MELTYSTAIAEQEKEIKSLVEAQDANFAALMQAKKSGDVDKISAAKAVCQENITKIEAKSKDYADDLQMHKTTQDARDAIKSANGADRKVGWGNGGGYGGDVLQLPESDYRTLGQRFVESDTFKSGMSTYKSSPLNVEIDDVSVKSLNESQNEFAAMKTTMTTAAGWAPYGPRMPGVIPSAQRIPAFADLIPQQDTQSPIFFYMEETTFTNNAAYVAEGAIKPESAFGLISRTVQASKIATTLPVSEEQLEDIPGIRDYIDNRMTLQIQLAEESALLNYTSGANGWDGFLQKAGVQTQAAGADPTPTAVLKAVVKVMYSPGFAGMPTGLAMNPIDWQNVLTLQETTGAYIWSAPSAPTQMPEQRMWGMLVRPVVAMPQGTSLLGNFQTFSKLWRRAGLTIRVAYANDDVLKNLVRLIAEERVALQISRAAAFATISGLPA